MDHLDNRLVFLLLRDLQSCLAVVGKQGCITAHLRQCLGIGGEMEGETEGAPAGLAHGVDGDVLLHQLVQDLGSYAAASEERGREFASPK